MELKGVKNIIFDLGGVLLNLDLSLTHKAFFKLGVTDFQMHHSQAKQGGLFDSWEEGSITEDEFCSQLREITAISASNEQITFAWNAMLLDFPLERKNLLMRLKKEFNTSLLSNTNETHVRAFHKIIDDGLELDSLESLFHSYYFSNEIGYRKPNKEAFEFVLNQNNYLATETLFIDDTKEHVDAAKKLGIQTHYLNLEDNQSLINLFNEY